MKPTCTQPFKVVRFVVLACGREPKPCATELEARVQAIASAKRWGWADYYRVEGEPATDIWRKPELLGGFEAEEAMRAVA